MTTGTRSKEAHGFSTREPPSDGAGALLIGPYRYRLWRVWEPDAPRLAFVLLNPSTADATRDDATLRRCLGFARRWGFGALEVVNLFALRSPSPAALRAAADPVGPDNDRWLMEVAGRADAVVAGWGNHGALLGRAEAVRARLPAGTLCLGVTASGQPRHPLYVAGCCDPSPLPPPLGGEGYPVPKVPASFSPSPPRGGGRGEG